MAGVSPPEQLMKSRPIPQGGFPFHDMMKGLSCGRAYMLLFFMLVTQEYLQDTCHLHAFRKVCLTYDIREDRRPFSVGSGERGWLLLAGDREISNHRGESPRFLHP
jgi:hypothetical protein